MSYQDQLSYQDFDFDSTVCSLTPRCDAYLGTWLCGVMHTTELDSAVGCTRRNFLRNFDYLTLQCRRAWLCGVMHTLESDKMSVFHVFIFVTCFKNSMFYWKTPEVKNFHWTICNLCYNFHINLFRHHREITIVKLRGIMHNTEFFETLCFLDSAVCSLQYEAHFRVFDTFWGFSLFGVMHTVESDFAVWCTPLSLAAYWDAHHKVFIKIEISQWNRKRIQKYCSAFCQGPGWIWIMKK